MAKPCELTSLIFSSVIIFLASITIIANACPEGGLYADPSNCANYIQCANNQEVVRPCPQGLLFNPSSSTCDWPQNVNCGSGGGSDGSQTTTAGTTTTTTMDPSCGGDGSSTQPLPSTTTTTQKTTAGSTTTIRTTTSSAPSLPTAGPGVQPSSTVRFAPYYDVMMSGPGLTNVYSKTGQKDFTLAFALGSSEGCKPKWGGQSDINDPSILGPVKQLQALGGQFIVATGGAMGPYFENLCTTVDDLANAYKTVLDAVGTNHIDVDVESTVNADRMNQALAKVQSERPNTTVSFTLMVQAEDYGLTPALGVDILKNAKANGVRVSIVNPMTMEFGGPSADFGDSVIGAAKSVLQQMKQIWPEKSQDELNGMLGVTPMLGRNYNGKIFTQDHARKLVNWGNQNKIGLLAFWSVGRDNGNCAGGSISPSCSSIAQTEYEFTKIFQNFRK